MIQYVIIDHLQKDVKRFYAHGNEKFVKKREFYAD